MNTLSLRGRLFLLIVAPLIVVAAISATARYIAAERLSQRLYDNTLLAVALTISRDVVLSEGDLLGEPLMAALTRALGDPVHYRITGPDGRFVTGYSNAPARSVDQVLRNPDGNIPHFYDSTALGQPVRVVALREFINHPQFGGWVTVEVWQTVTQRDALSLELLVQSIVLMGALVVTAALMVWFGINRGLRPLLQLRSAVVLRSPDDLHPIRRAVPRELRSLVAAMNSLFDRLSEAFSLRDAFISDAAHQMRNPVAAIQAQAEAAVTAPNEAELRRRVAELAETARRAGRLTNQLLSMERIRGRKLRLAVGQTDLAELASARARGFAERVLRRDVTVSFTLTGAPRSLQADGVLLGEMMENILDNALIYGCPPGRAAVEVDLAFEMGAVVFSVTDTGPGIPVALRERVFDRFFRLQDADDGGCGLGLAIVQDVAEAHGGTARVASHVGGARIEVSLPG